MLYVTGVRGLRARGGSPQPELYAVDAADGSLEWKTETPSVALYVVGTGDAVVLVQRGGARMFSVGDGTELAKTSAVSASNTVRATPVVDGRVVTATADGLTALDIG